MVDIVTGRAMIPSNAAEFHGRLKQLRFDSGHFGHTHRRNFYGSGVDMGLGTVSAEYQQFAADEFITIPFDYNQLTPEKRGTIIPICIRKMDRAGQPIAWRWFSDGVVPIADRLRWLARSVLGDDWLVSELTETSLHALWYKHGERMGLWPSRLLYKHAKWRAEDMRVGGWRARRGFDVALGELEAAIREPRNFADDYQNRQTIDALREQLLDRGQADIAEMMDMFLHNCPWEEIASLSGRYVTPKNINTIQRRFWRTVIRAASLL